MRILHVIPSVNPLTGGPIEGVKQRGTELIRLGHSVEIVCLDDPNAAHLVDFPLPVHALGPSYGAYQYNRKLIPWLIRHAPAFDAVIVSGLWQYHAFATRSALRQIGKPYFIFTHGMLDPWFKQTYPIKHFKKWLYWPWAEYRVLRDAQAVLFTSEEERLRARQSFWLYRVHEKVVAYGSGAPPDDREHLREEFLMRFPELRNRRILIFLGRIHEKKGCDLLIEALGRVKELIPDLHLVMAGPDQDGWLVKLQQLAVTHGVQDKITWPGMLRDTLKWGAFYASEAFILPSHQENFGIAVAEALSCGVPVLISDKINIWREIDAAGAGFVAADTVDGTENNLRRWLQLDISSRMSMGTHAIEAYAQHFSIAAMTASFLTAICETP